MVPTGPRQTWCLARSMDRKFVSVTPTEMLWKSAILRSATAQKRNFFSFSRRGRGRTQLSLLPRSLHRQSGPASKVENGTAADRVSATASAAANAAGETKPLSNSDFARMLLSKWEDERGNSDRLHTESHLVSLQISVGDFFSAIGYLASL